MLAINTLNGFILKHILPTSLNKDWLLAPQLLILVTNRGIN